MAHNAACCSMCTLNRYRTHIHAHAHAHARERVLMRLALCIHRSSLSFSEVFKCICVCVYVRVRVCVAVLMVWCRLHYACVDCVACVDFLSAALHRFLHVIYTMCAIVERVACAVTMRATCIQTHAMRIPS